LYAKIIVKYALEIEKYAKNIPKNLNYLRQKCTVNNIIVVK